MSTATRPTSCARPRLASFMGRSTKDEAPIQLSGDNLVKAQLLALSICDGVMIKDAAGVWIERTVVGLESTHAIARPSRWLLLATRSRRHPRRADACATIAVSTLIVAGPMLDTLIDYSVDQVEMVNPTSKKTTRAAKEGEVRPK